MGAWIAALLLALWLFWGYAAAVVFVPLIHARVCHPGLSLWQGLLEWAGCCERRGAAET